MRIDVESESGNTPSQLDPEDHYFEGGYLVFTAAYHLKRGYCCGSDCRHCPYREEEGAEKPADGEPA